MSENEPATDMTLISDALFTVDERWVITSFNKRAEELMGLRREEVIGKDCHEVFQDSDRFDDLCRLAGPLALGRGMSHCRLIFPCPDSGENQVVLATAIPLPGKEGKLGGAVIALRDAFGPSLIEPLVLSSIADGVFSVDRTMRITSFNRAAEQITGWKSREVIGLPCSEVLKASICGSTCILAQSVDQDRSIAKRNIFIKGKDGRTIPISIVAAPLVDHQGTVIGGVEAFHDITAIMQHDLILESVADGVFTVDRNWKISSFNRAAALITGWAREDAVGRSCGDVFRSSICGENCALAESLYTGKPVANRSTFIRNMEGERIPISISAAPLLDHEGNIIGGVETFRDLSVVTALRKQLSKRFTFGEILSKSAAMQRIFAILPEIAQSDSNVLVLGESGTGKELVARAIHTSSLRHRGPFVAVNCGALPETLLESELFGYKAGAFTGAKQDRAGRFAAAEKGTLFLDEIGDIPPSLQVKLLRVLQNRVYEPLGSNQPVKADVRIIAATNRDLQALVEESAFREDLFYRLNVVKIQLPPLRERKEDIPMLVEHFIHQFSAQKGKDIVGISESALSELMRYSYPGNIRELENVIEYAFILCPGGFIQPSYLPEPFAPREKGEPLGTLVLEKPHTLEEVEKQAIYQALERNHWRRLATCRELGISKDTLRRKIRRYELQDPFGTEME